MNEEKSCKACGSMEHGSMRIYLAAPFREQERMRRYADQLRSAGHVVTSRWLVEESSKKDNGDAFSSSPEEIAQQARNDINDICNAEVLIAFPPDGPARGGMHVEFGIALAMGLMLLVVGPRPTIFHHLPKVIAFATWEEARAFMGGHL